MVCWCKQFGPRLGEHSTKLLTFIKLPLVFNCLFLSGRLTQDLLYLKRTILANLNCHVAPITPVMVLREMPLFRRNSRYLPWISEQNHFINSEIPFWPDACLIKHCSDVI